MRRFRGTNGQRPRADAAAARDLVDLASRMGIPPEDAARQVAQLINDANRPESEVRIKTPVSPRY